MNADGPGNGKQDHRPEPARRVQMLVLAVQHHRRDHRIQQQVTAERNHVPEHHGMQRGVQEHVQNTRIGCPISTKMKSMHMMTAAMARNSPRIVILPNCFDVVKVVRQHHHHRGSGDAHEESELADIDSPTDVAAHAGNAQAVR